MPPASGREREQKNRLFASRRRYDCKRLQLLEGTGVPLSADLHLMGRLEEGPSGLFLLLRTGDGGVWELEARRSTRGLIGCQVEVVGRRAGFNGLVCDQIWPAGQSRPRRSKFNLEYLLVGAFVAYGLITTLAGLAGYFG